MSTKNMVTLDDLKALVPKSILDQIYTVALHDAKVSLLSVKLNEISGDIKQLLGLERPVEIPHSLVSGKTVAELSDSPSSESDIFLQTDGIYVSEDVVEFLEIHGAIAASVINKRPIMSGVRSGYTPQAEPQLTIIRGDTYGLDHHMRNIFITFKLFADEPQLEGEYWESGFQAGPAGLKVPLSGEQVSQIIQMLVERVRGINAQNNPIPE